MWPVGQAVKTEASHASNMGSIPVRVTTVGVFNGEGPPVPIPNTEVKLTSADDTCLATGRKNRSMPTRKTLKSFDFKVFSFPVYRSRRLTSGVRL